MPPPCTVSLIVKVQVEPPPFERWPLELEGDLSDYTLTEPESSCRCKVEATPVPRPVNDVKAVHPPRAAIGPSVRIELRHKRDSAQASNSHSGSATTRT